MEKRQVVIVGAGPVGLLTALGLARQGIQVTVLDAETEVIRAPRASVYFHTTLSVLRKLGLDDDAHAVGEPSHLFMMHWPASGDVMRSDMRDALDPGQEFDHNLHFGQDLLADMVLRHLAAHPHAEVLWDHTVTALGQVEGSARVKADTEEGERVFEADWVIGADGARSGVRSLLGLPFEGFTWPERFVAANISYPFAECGFANANMVVDPVNWAVIARLGQGNLWRVTFGEDADLPERSLANRLPGRLAQILPDPALPHVVHEFSPYRVHQRCAPRFRVGRVLLAGDAAHSCNPCGGMGLTSGVLDADMLSDALGAVIAGRGGEDLLDFYAAERRRVFQDVAAPLSAHFKRLLSESDPAQREADKQAMLAGARKGGAEIRSSSLAERIRGNPLPL
ncbi:NAD(P)-binding protein [Altererythrobacter xixiisoli]|uniref:NAD(P)-binding protein n=1 Tax=Croceibacterium xixiisoli TaxID=1476466 RepID=A0A6I4TRL2_9SPHN|nr:FAD-dependent oxidoreductase [Croceibacterium xixiisoli]MXO97547.1 NAD(P)-binding protein [Croceibacterium xixiisoli]